jgi:DNA-binding transcriptional LysR family regulator
MGGFPQRRLWTDRYVPAVWAQNRDVGDVLDRETIERLPYLRYNGMGGDSFIDIQLTARGIRPRVTLSTQNFTLVPSLLPGTSLFGFVHERLIAAFNLRRELRVLDTEIEFSPISETMYWHPVFHRDPAHHWLRERVGTLAANL